MILETEEIERQRPSGDEPDWGRCLFFYNRKLRSLL